MIRFSKVLFFLTILLGGHWGLAQDKFAATFGDRSPVIIGAKGTIDYHNSQRIDRQIPEDLLPMIAGLLLTNEVKASAVEQPVLAWIDRYNELRTIINQQTDYGLKAQLLRFLAAGRLADIEDRLTGTTQAPELKRFFPLQFGRGQMTTGDNSPVIVGDEATVKYVVEQIITYQLPEQLSLNLLRNLRAERNDNARLLNNLRQQRKAVEGWIAKFRDVEQQLKNTSGEIARRAYEKFAKGDLLGALAELEQMEGAAQQVARGAILSAKILLLTPFSEMTDKVVFSIRRKFEQAISLRDSLNDRLDF
ncbi:MAG: hypothetical protein AAFN92_11210, partial [Bacteroidota bacterium]